MKQSTTIRADEVDIEKWEQAANLSGLSYSEWARRVLNEAAAGRRKIEAEEYLGVEKPDAEKAKPKKISDSAPPPITKSILPPTDMCQHDYGFKKCPIPNCRNYKWRE